MEIKIKPKIMTATKLEVNVIGSDENGVKFYWALKTEPSNKRIDEGTWTLPKQAFLLLGALEINLSGYIPEGEIKDAIKQILSQPDIDIELPDFIPDPNAD